MQRKQTTSYVYVGKPQEVRVEPRDNTGALSIPPASERGKNDTQQVGENLLERILINSQIDISKIITLK
jgi:hypothetical protein